MAKKRPKSVGGKAVASCGSRSDVRASVTNSDVEQNEQVEKKEQSMIKIGKPAPDFELSAFHNGEFKTVKLSDYKGKWVLLCFYPGDFTFV